MRDSAAHDGVLAGGVPVIVVESQSGLVLDDPGSLPMVVCALGASAGAAGPSSADVVVSADEIDSVVTAVARSPLAAATLVMHLRAAAGVPIEHGLALESAAYSTLQAGPEFTRWRAHASPGPEHAEGPTVHMERDGDVLRVTLMRPDRHNAINARLRDELCEALSLAIADRSVSSVELRGAGSSFCSGGDLAEFGQRSDPSSAHRLRLVRSPARLVHRLADRTTVYIHGATLGGGLELAAFAGTVVADLDVELGLPELALGLIPGAGGTISLPRRIGRQRTALLALTGKRIDAQTAMAWGLVDRVVPE